MLDKHRQNKILPVFLCIIVLSFTGFFSFQHHVNWLNGFHVESPNVTKMGLLFVSSFAFALTVLFLGRGWKDEEGNQTEDAISRSFKISFSHSEAPMCAGFFLLFLYSYLLGEDRIKNEQMDSFFAGAIALQMMVSNIIWVFADDALVEN